jgi:hypothetical protein
VSAILNLSLSRQQHADGYFVQVSAAFGAKIYFHVCHFELAVSPAAGITTELSGQFRVGSAPCLSAPVDFSGRHFWKCSCNRPSIAVAIAVQGDWFESLLVGCPDSAAVCPVIVGGLTLDAGERLMRASRHSAGDQPWFICGRFHFRWI